MVRVHPIPVQSNPRHRLRMCRHRASTPIPRSVRHRDRHTKSSSRGDHHQPDRTVDHPSRPKPDEPLRRTSSVQVPDPRRRRTIHQVLRRRPRRIRHHRNQNTTTLASSKRIRRTMGPDTPSRTPRPNHHLERAPTPPAPRRIRRALQQQSPFSGGFTNGHPTTPPMSPRSAQANRSNVTQPAPD